MLINRFCIVLIAALILGHSASADLSGPVHVVDADTIKVHGQSIRLHAIDAPEVKQHCGGPGQPVWACGIWVKTRAQELFEGQFAQCEALETDRYGRMVARCLVNGQDMGQVLVSQGLAFAYRKYGWDYDLDEKGAAVSGRGLHGTGVVNPAEYRAQGRDARAKWSLNNAPDGCVIKGNISGSGERIFHMPGQAWYNVTTIRADKKERWFCTADQARSAGWRPAKK
ncbi:thermonuclease family protein [Pelagimonas varians]|uniref:Succinoglycan biosynthesis protein ExoI n=1 Tax=Pelagimonas varians TaxID=696760 RepID=A0A238KX53_9RHOB|nr:thermonuclease family protein [Pelagimonas varians]PYG27759.1 endonuclease YncB(thermonuclease family) [Pelagimonas varians]SMX47414.1 Succinoglycan biosynthesis protein ExoI [Pelagimonas varians]